jgi:hypothetical protein
MAGGKRSLADATNRTVAQFFEEKTTRASYDVFEAWVGRHGLPARPYVDRDSIYRCERVARVEEQKAGQEPQTQFGRAMKELGVELILAHSPQAKGRVGRRNGLLQDRLVKEMRLAGSKRLEKGNAFLDEKFLPALNEKFNVQARRSSRRANSCKQSNQGDGDILKESRQGKIDSWLGGNG